MTEPAQFRAIPAAVLCAAVAIGCAIGALSRFETGALVMERWGGGDFLATAIVNIVGSFIIMLFATLTAAQGRYPMGEISRQFLMAGFCGGYTTRSLMGLETFLLILDHHWFYGAAYVVGVVMASLAAATVGYVIAVAINQHASHKPVEECRALS